EVAEDLGGEAFPGAAGENGRGVYLGARYAFAGLVQQPGGDAGAGVLEALGADPAGDGVVGAGEDADDAGAEAQGRGAAVGVEADGAGPGARGGGDVDEGAVPVGEARAAAALVAPRDFGDGLGVRPFPRDGGRGGVVVLEVEGGDDAFGGAGAVREGGAEIGGG